MRFIIRGIAIGLLTGALFFFFPFLFRFLFFFLLIGFIIRMLFGWGWRRHRYHRYRDDFYNDSIISIDGRGYTQPVNEEGTERRVTVK